MSVCDNGWGRLHKCPGSYCGRSAMPGELHSDCGSCLRGYIRNDPPFSLCSECVRCSDSPNLYDWFFLLFMAGLGLTLNSFYIEYTNSKKIPQLLLLHISSICECMAAAIVTLLLFDPVGRLTLTSCRPTKLQDWYTMFHNPYNVTNNVASRYSTLHCTQERVYPLYSFVLIFYGFSLLFLLLFRPFVSAFFVQGKGRKCIYAALYFYPILIGIHAAGGGLVYFCYPYLTLCLSLITIAIHFALRTERLNRPYASLCRSRHTGAWDLLQDTAKNPRNLAIVLAHWLAHAFGILTILVARFDSASSIASLAEEFSRVLPYLPILVTIPIPTVFYLLTVRFTDPQVLKTE